MQINPSPPSTPDSRYAHPAVRLSVLLIVLILIQLVPHVSQAQAQLPSNQQQTTTQEHALSPIEKKAVNQDEIVLNTSDQFQRLLPSIMILRDFQKNIAPEEIDSLWQRGKFEAPNRQTAGQGLITYPIWGRFVLHNPTAKSIPLVLEYIDHSLVYMDLYSVQQGKLQHHGHASYLNAFDTRPMEHLRYAYPVTLEPEETRVFYVRMSGQTGGPLFTDMRVWNQRDFAQFKHREMFTFGAFFGYLSIIFLISLATYYSTGHIALLFYAVFVFSNIYGWGSITGYLPEIFIRDGYHWRHMIMGGAVNVSFSALFTRSLLNTKLYLPRLDRFIILLAILGVIPFISALLEYSVIAVVTMELQLLGMSLLILAGILRARQGETVALVFTLAWALYISGMTIYPLREFGVIDHTPITYWWSPVGAIVEVSLLLAVIVLWIRNNQRSKQLAKQQYLHGLEDQKRRLELEVQARTADLQSEKEKAEREARTDSLTLLPNRRHFLERLERELERAKRLEQPLCLMLIDLDYFKRINDDYGHHVGDKALQHISLEISNMIRSYDLLARLGGEEFGLLMTETDITQGQEFAERIRAQTAATPMMRGDLPIQVTLTAGLVQARDGESSSDILSRVDNLLYKGKSSGRNLIIAEHTPDNDQA